ncbi:hypothetical protein C1645_315652 [Glomus cerebriforme]|uniref:Uncharacterized protein n=1 Tax=Glomus cerebriforme TaxID=658196 RepID=A0A397SVT5_9GLOM|nr:hypothetical protein C1645_315652 [Glomus cerebriforme]
MRFLPLIIVFLLLIILSILGFAPNVHIETSDKLLHFIGFFILTIAIYCVWDQNIKWNTAVTGTISFSASLISEAIQGLLPVSIITITNICKNKINELIIDTKKKFIQYKIFDWQDIVV